MNNTITLITIKGPSNLEYFAALLLFTTEYCKELGYSPLLMSLPDGSIYIVAEKLPATSPVNPAEAA